MTNCRSPFYEPEEFYQVLLRKESDGVEDDGASGSASGSASGGCVLSVLLAACEGDDVTYKQQTMEHDAIYWLLTHLGDLSPDHIGAWLRDSGFDTLTSTERKAMEEESQEKKRKQQEHRHRQRVF